MKNNTPALVNFSLVQYPNSIFKNTYILDLQHMAENLSDSSDSSDDS